MQVITFEVEEITGALGTMAADAEAIELCEKLGLKGQLKQANPTTATRQPYRKWTALEKLVYETVLTNRTELEDYSDGPIPLRVLQVVALCKQESFFDKYIILHPEPGKTDPVLIGLKNTNPQYSWQFDEYILARWGEILEPFEQLAAKAKDIWISSYKTKLKKAQQEIKHDIDNLEETAQEMFLTGKQKNAYYTAF